MKKQFAKTEFIIICLFSLIVIYGIREVYSFAKNAENYSSVFSTSPDQRYAGVKYNEKRRNEAKRAAENILGNSIKVRTSQYNGTEDKIICYTRNVYIELDSYSMKPVFIFYECEIGEPRKMSEEYLDEIECFILRNAPRRLKTNDVFISCTAEDEKIAQYNVKFSEGTVFITVRRDTGTIIFYDAGELFKRY